MSFIDEIAKKHCISRICYGHDENNKPNDHCHWTQLSANLWGWIENDNNFRDRVKTAHLSR